MRSSLQPGGPGFASWAAVGQMGLGEKWSFGDVLRYPIVTFFLWGGAVFVDTYVYLKFSRYVFINEGSRGGLNSSYHARR